MRYKVKAPDLLAYRDVVAFLHRRSVPILVASERRRQLAVEDLPDTDLQEIADRGGEITLDAQYDLEAKL